MTATSPNAVDRSPAGAGLHWYATPSFVGAGLLLAVLTFVGWLGVTGRAGQDGDAPDLPRFSVAQILDAGRVGVPADGWRIARVAQQPRIVVIEFPTLAAQGEAMNRIAALIEKPGAPRDRVLDDVQLAQFIANQDDEPATFLLGHDYRGSDLALFFDLAARQAMQLDAAELRLLGLLRQHGMLAERAGRFGAGPTPWALVSFTRVQHDDPATAADETLDAPMRESIARHELSHGLYFTDAGYREHCRQFWRQRLTPAERDRIGRFLAGLGYDRSNEDLMINEAQAFLMHTADARAFDAAALGASQPELADLRARFASAPGTDWSWLTAR